MSEWAKIGDEELHAFIDGELDDPRRQQVEQLVAQVPALSERVAAFRGDKARLLHIYGGLIERPLPQKWLALIEEGTRKRRVLAFPWPAMAAIAATVVTLLFGTFLYRQILPPAKDDIIAEALAARDYAVAPRAVETIDPDSAPAARDRELAAALSMHVKTPDLAKAGYRLARLQIYGGVPGGQAVELVYRGRDNNLVTLYLRHATTAPRFDQFQTNGVRVCIWQDDVMGTVVAGKMSVPEMERLVVLAYNQLNA